MTANDVYELVLYAASKNLQQGYISPDDFNNIIMPLGQKSYLDYLLGQYQKYQIQRPIPPVQFGQNERVRQSIAPLIYNIILNPTLTADGFTGIATYPSDFEYNDAMWSENGLYNIKFIQQDRLSSYYRSVIDPIAQNPVYLEREEGFWFVPNVAAARMSYVRKPPPIHWGYVLDGNGVPVYNPATSQDPIWSDTDILQVIVRGLAVVGVNLQVGTLMQYSNEIKNGGQ